MDGNYTVLRSSEQLKEVYSEKTKYTKKQWLEDLSHNGYIEIKTIVENM